MQKIFPQGILIIQTQYAVGAASYKKKLVNNKYLALNKKTQVITPTLLGEMIYDVVNASIRSLLNPELTASWEKGLTYVAEGSITPQEYMVKLEHFVRSRTNGVLGLNNQYALREYFQIWQSRRVLPFFRMFLNPALLPVHR